MGGVSIMDIMYWTFPDRPGKWSIAAGRKDVLTCGLTRLPITWYSARPGALVVPMTEEGILGTRWKEGPAVQKGVPPEVPDWQPPMPAVQKGVSPLTTPPMPELPKVDVWQTQVGGNHYTKLKIQPMQYSMANGLDALQHTVIKYVTRFRDKAGIVDLEKARQTLDLLIAFEKDKKNG